MYLTFYLGISGLINALASFVTGLYVYVQDKSSALHKSFFYFVLSVSLWAFFYAVWQFQSQKELALFFIRLAMVPVPFIPFSFAWFVVVLTENNRYRRYGYMFAVLPGSLSIFSFTELIVADVTPKMLFPFWPVPGSLGCIVCLVYILGFIWGLSLLIKRWFASTGMYRAQIIWVTIPIFIGFLGGATNWFLWFDIPISPAPNIFVGLMFLCLAYALIKRRLLDIDSIAGIIRRAKLNSLGLLAASINHEVKTPLFIIRGLSETFATNLNEGVYKTMDEIKADGEKIHQKIVNESEKIFKIVKNFSNYAREGTISKDETVTTLNIRQTIDSIFSFICHDCGSDKIFLVCDIAADVRFIPMVRQHFEEVMTNVMTNACQAMNEGGRLYVSAKKSDRTIAVEVSDEGCGLSEEELKCLFVPFYTTKPTGTGLGLFIVKSLVEKNGGKINVTSRFKKGTTVRLEFPICRDFDCKHIPFPTG